LLQGGNIVACRAGDFALAWRLDTFFHEIAIRVHSQKRTFFRCGDEPPSSLVVALDPSLLSNPFDILVQLLRPVDRHGLIPEDRCKHGGFLEGCLRG
jgi:hypothetical protein